MISKAFEACLGCIQLMKRAKGAFLVGDLTLSPPLQPLTVIPDPSRDPRDRWDPGQPILVEQSRSWRSCRSVRRKGNIPEEIAPRSAFTPERSRRCLCVFLFVAAAVVCVADGGGGGGGCYITAMLLSNCLLLSLVTTVTSVIGISAFRLHCGASAALLAALPLPRAAGPMPHKYKHNLSYTS